jgi:hypothetical protein
MGGGLYRVGLVLRSTNGGMFVVRWEEVRCLIDLPPTCFRSEEFDLHLVILAIEIG